MSLETRCQPNRQHRQLNTNRMAEDSDLEIVEFIHLAPADELCDASSEIWMNVVRIPF